MTTTDDRLGAAPEPVGAGEPDRLRRADPEQRPAGHRSAAAARAGGVAAEVPGLVEGPRAGAADQGRLPAHRGRGRAGTAGRTTTSCRCRTTAGGSSWPRPTRTGAIKFGQHKGEPAWQTVPGEYRAELLRLIVVQGDTEPASVEQQRHLGADRAEPVRPAQPVPGQRRGGPPPVGDGVPAARVLRPGGAGGGRAAAAAQQRRLRQPADPRGVQRGHHRLAAVLHVHLLHRPGREVPARDVEGERVRPAGAHVRVHAQGGGAPHVRGHHRRAADRRADRAADGRARQRGRAGPRRDPAGDHPAVPELPVLGLAGPVRVRAVQQRGDVLHHGAEGPLGGGAAQGRPRPARRHPRADQGGRRAAS